MADTVTRYMAGDFCFTVAYEGEATEIVKQLLADLEHPFEGEAESAFELCETEVESGDESGEPPSVTWVEDGENRGQHTVGRLLDQLIGRLNRGVVDHSPSRLNLHAGSVTRDGRTLVLPADRGSGKTTLTSALSRSGWTYLTDEVVGVKPDGVSIVGFPKPLTYKPGTLELFPGLERDPIVAAQVQDVRFYVPASSLGAGHANAATATTVAFPTYTKGADCAVTRLSPAQATSRLVTNAFDFDRRGAAEALLSLARMAVECVCVDLIFDDLDDAVAALAEVALESPSEPPDLSILGAHSEAPPDLEPPDSFSESSRPWWASGIHGVLLGDESVLHHPDSKQVAVIDALSTLMWESFNGQATLSELADELGSIYEAPPQRIETDLIALCESLAAHGLVLSA